MLKQLYVSIEGRCSRKFYWLFGFLLGFFITVLKLDLFITLFITLLFLPAILAMQIKRWHDIGLTGWLSILTLVPYLGILVVITVGVIPGNEEENKYGPNPLSKSSGVQNAP